MSFNLRPILTGWLRQDGRLDVKEVVSYEDDTEAGGYCESCYYEEAIVRIKYLNSADELKEYVYYGGFADLISQLEGTDLG